MVRFVSGRAALGRLLLGVALVSHLSLGAAHAESDTKQEGHRPATTSAGPADPSPDSLARVETTRTYYDLVGSDATTLADQIAAYGPRDAEGSWAALTEWRVTWSYSAVGGEGGCSVGAVDVRVTIRYTFPRWTPPADAAPDLAARWERYLAALEEHEQGHAAIAIEAGHAVASTARGLPAFPTCNELAREARERIAAVIADCRQRQADYDRATGHGATQGATFP